MDEQPETKTPIGEKHSFNWRMFLLWTFMVLLLYVLSAGPVLMVIEKNIIADENDFVYELYTPVEWAYENTPFHKPLGMYFRLWMPEYFEKNGDVSQPQRQTVPPPKKKEK